MKKIIFLLMILFLASCQKSYKCERTVTKTYDDRVVFSWTEVYWVDEFTCTKCNNFERLYYDTIIRTNIKCK
jgi:hypothetical protein